jgi:hypothetical protein
MGLLRCLDLLQSALNGLEPAIVSLSLLGGRAIFAAGHGLADLGKLLPRLQRLRVARFNLACKNWEIYRPQARIRRFVPRHDAADLSRIRAF